MTPRTRPKLCQRREPGQLFLFFLLEALNCVLQGQRAGRHLGLGWGGSEILDPGKGETDCLGEVWVGEPAEPIHLQGISQEEEFGGK